MPGRKEYNMDTIINGQTYQINFKWDMQQDGFNTLFAPLPEKAQDVCDYCGAVFFGNMKLEFIRNDVAGGYLNLFERCAEDMPGGAYGYLEDGIPYEERDPYPTVDFPDLENMKPEDRPSFDTFTKGIEDNIILLLKDNPDLIPAATVPTDPNKWYPCDHPYKVTNVTRDV